MPLPFQAIAIPICYRYSSRIVIVIPVGYPSVTAANRQREQDRRLAFATLSTCLPAHLLAGLRCLPARCLHVRRRGAVFPECSRLLPQPYIVVARVGRSAHFNKVVHRRRPAALLHHHRPPSSPYPARDHPVPVCPAPTRATVPGALPVLPLRRSCVFRGPAQPAPNRCSYAVASPSLPACQSQCRRRRQRQRCAPRPRLHPHRRAPPRQVACALSLSLSFSRPLRYEVPRRRACALATQRRYVAAPILPPAHCLDPPGSGQHHSTQHSTLRSQLSDPGSPATTLSEEL